MKLKSKDLKEGDWVNIYSEFGCSKVVEIWISDGKLVGYDILLPIKNLVGIS